MNLLLALVFMRKCSFCSKIHNIHVRHPDLTEIWGERSAKYQGLESEPKQSGLNLKGGLRILDVQRELREAPLLLSVEEKQV